MTKPNVNGRLTMAEIRLPLIRRSIGLGDAIKAVTGAIGVKPCAACLKRAERLNAKLKLVPR